MGWIIDLVIDHNINISKCNPLAGSSSVKLPKESNHPKKDLINIQNINDNECFKWCLVTYLPPGYHRAAGIRKVDLLFGDELDFEDIKYPDKTKDIPKIGKKEFYRH